MKRAVATVVHGGRVRQVLESASGLVFIDGDFVGRVVGGALEIGERTTATERAILAAVTKEEAA